MIFTMKIVKTINNSGILSEPDRYRDVRSVDINVSADASTVFATVPP